MPTEFVLDAWAVLALFQDEQPAASRVAAVLTSGDTAMTWVNVGEVAYIVERHHGRRRSASLVAALQRRLRRTAPADGDLTMAAAAVKARGGMSFADAFAVALALREDAVLLTGDDELLGADAPWTHEDLRVPPE